MIHESEIMDHALTRRLGPGDVVLDVVRDLAGDPGGENPAGDGVGAVTNFLLIIMLTPFNRKFRGFKMAFSC